MTPVARQCGFSNHTTGSPELRLSAVADANRDGRVDLALPRADRLELRIITLADGDTRAIAAVPLPARIDKAIGVLKTGGDPSFLVGLTNGQVCWIGRSGYDPAKSGEK